MLWQWADLILGQCLSDRLEYVDRCKCIVSENEMFSVAIVTSRYGHNYCDTDIVIQMSPYTGLCR